MPSPPVEAAQDDESVPPAQPVAAGRRWAVIVGAFMVTAAVWIVATGGPFDRTQTSARSGATAPAHPTTTRAVDTHVPLATAHPPWYTPTAKSDLDYVIDLNNGEMTPLPDAIIRSPSAYPRLAETAEPLFALTRYAVSSDGSMLAFVGTGEEGTPQIFIAGIDGTGVRQVTHDPTGARSPAWSPDGTTIAYSGDAGGFGQRAGFGQGNLYVVDVATGESRLIRQGGGSLYSPQFTPNGSSLLYSDWNITTAARTAYPVLRIVPVTGGESTLLFGEGHGGLADARNGSLSPDGSLVTMAGTRDRRRRGLVQFVANADGTGLRQIPGRACSPAGTWSPDGRRIVCSDEAGGIVVVDIATEDSSLVANGRAAIWLDDHTLLVEV